MSFLKLLTEGIKSTQDEISRTIYCNNVDNINAISHTENKKHFITALFPCTHTPKELDKSRQKAKFRKIDILFDKEYNVIPRFDNESLNISFMILEESGKYKALLYVFDETSKKNILSAALHFQSLDKIVKENGPFFTILNKENPTYKEIDFVCEQFYNKSLRSQSLHDTLLNFSVDSDKIINNSEKEINKLVVTMLNKNYISRKLFPLITKSNSEHKIWFDTENLPEDKFYYNEEKSDFEKNLYINQNFYPIGIAIMDDRIDIFRYVAQEQNEEREYTKSQNLSSGKMPIFKYISTDEVIKYIKKIANEKKIMKYGDELTVEGRTLKGGFKLTK